jgi:hypothetical protein
MATTADHHHVIGRLGFGLTPGGRPVGVPAARSGQQLITSGARQIGEPIETTRVTRVRRGDLVVYPRRENAPKAKVEAKVEEKK